MKNIIIVLLFVLCSCSSSKNTSNNSVNSNEATKSNTLGSSFEDAVVIKSKNENDGVAAEYAWLKAHFSGYKLKSQSMSSKGKKSYDVIHILTKDNQEQTVYFDISNFFGKF